MPIASRTFSDKRARSHRSCPCRHFALYCSVPCTGLRGGGSRFLLPTCAAPQSHLPGTTHAFLTRMHTHSSPQPGRAAPPLALLPDGPGEARWPHQLPGWQVWMRRACSRPTPLATVPLPTCADPKEGGAERGAAGVSIFQLRTKDTAHAEDRARRWQVCCSISQMHNSAHNLSSGCKIWGASPSMFEFHV